jgi:hypothetical protein
MEGQATATHVLPAEWYDVRPDARPVPSVADKALPTLPYRKLEIEVEVGLVLERNGVESDHRKGKASLCQLHNVWKKEEHIPK